MKMKVGTKPTLTAQERMQKKLERVQDSKAPGSITLRIRLTGALADAWRSLRDASVGLDLSDSDLLGMLLFAAVRSVRSALRLMQREAQP
jgi:hypothetical protein